MSEDSTSTSNIGTIVQKKNGPVPEDVLKQLKAAHGSELTYIPAHRDKPKVGIVVRKPTRAEWDRAQEDLANEKKNKTTTIRTLILDLTVWLQGAGDALELFEVYPGMPALAMKFVAEMVGADEAIDPVKL